MNLNKTEMAGRIRREHGAFTLTEIMIVVAIIGLLAAIAIPNLLRAHQRATAKACINNLRQIDSAKQQWALETGQGPASVPQPTDINNYFRTMSVPTCPVHGIYNINAVTNAPDCSLAASLGHKLD